MRRRGNNETPKRAVRGRTAAAVTGASDEGSEDSFRPQRRGRAVATPSTAEKYMGYDRYAMSADDQLGGRAASGRRSSNRPSRNASAAVAALDALSPTSGAGGRGSGTSAASSSTTAASHPDSDPLPLPQPTAAPVPLPQSLRPPPLSGSLSDPSLGRLVAELNSSSSGVDTNVGSGSRGASSLQHAAHSNQNTHCQSPATANGSNASSGTVPGAPSSGRSAGSGMDLTLEEVGRSLEQGRAQPFDLSLVSVTSYVRAAVVGTDGEGGSGGGRFGVGGGAALTAEARANKKISNFFSVPLSLECLVWFGLLICLDAYLFLFTFLPLRFALQVAEGVRGLRVADATAPGSVSGCWWGPRGARGGAGSCDTPASPHQHRTCDDSGTPCNSRTGRSNSGSGVGSDSNCSSGSGSGSGSGAGNSGTLLGPLDTYDLVCMVVIGIACTALQSFDMSYTYHFIRGQTMIKLYVLTSMLDVLERLLCSFGEDALSSMHFYTRLLMLQQQQQPSAVGKVRTGGVGSGNGGRGGSAYSVGYWTLPYMLGSMSIYVLYVVVHACFYFIKVATLTVAFNTTDQSFISILILNNFAEMKVSVFKKFDSTQLFELTCTDIAERFQIALFLVCMVVVALAQSPRDATVAEIMLPFVRATAYMSVAEVLSDWIKHAFINKFNKFNPSVYDNFARRLRSDMLLSSSGSIGPKTSSDSGASGTPSASGGCVGSADAATPKKIAANSHDAMRKIGLTHIPLACVFIRYMLVASYMPRARALFHSMATAIRGVLDVRVVAPVGAVLAAVGSLVPPAFGEMWGESGGAEVASLAVSALPTLHQLSATVLYVLLGVAAFGVLLLLKVGVGMYLIYYCGHVHNRELEELRKEAEERQAQAEALQGMDS